MSRYGRFLSGKEFLKDSLGVPGAQWNVPGGPLGVPEAPLGSWEASLGVLFTATDGFVMYTWKIICFCDLLAATSVTGKLQRGGPGPSQQIVGKWLQRKSSNHEKVGGGWFDPRLTRRNFTYIHGPKYADLLLSVEGDGGGLAA